MSEVATLQEMVVTPASTCRAFLNSATDTSYRLRVDERSWRITKSRPVGDTVILHHLRGEVTQDIVRHDLIARVVRGDRGLPIASGDPFQAFAAVIRWDLDRTFDVLAALAREAQLRRDRGIPGFRAQAPILRTEAAAALATAAAGCRAMAQAWLAAGFPGEPLPWMAAIAADAASGARG